MNAYYWFILNTLLIAGAFFSTKYARGTLQQIRKADRIEKAEPAVKKSPRGQSRPAPAKVLPEAGPVQASPQTMDFLWEKTLFKPDRTENQVDGAGDSSKPEDQARQQQANSQFELVGLLRVKNDSLSPVAIIKQKVQNTRRYVNRGYRARNTPVEPEKSKPLKRIFRIGDPINESGYILTDINLLANSLTLTRGTETLELKIQLGDNSSNERKKQATDQAARLREKREKIAATSMPTAKDKKQAPPPPPKNVKNSPQPLDPRKMTPQQIREAIIARQKLLLQKNRKK